MRFNKEASTALAMTIIVVIVLISLLSSVTYSTLSPDDPLLQRAMNLLARIQELDRKGMNVTDLVRELNESISLLQQGRRNEASQLLDDLEVKVEHYEAVSDSYYRRIILEKYAVVGGLLSIPVLFYLLFPRAYLYLWFRLRRRWIVRGSA